jgi:hypothetical protein
MTQQSILFIIKCTLNFASSAHSLQALRQRKQVDNLGSNPLDREKEQKSLRQLGNAKT